ncbi:lytic murein transglycosylase [uncultured Modestobacter sp.]|uniref:lytic murein transglycosylase n=1 Tax=uncultured Modestobacter sp. TaxID=380048 RepID=UPI0026206502|nr:lytic murein transglycosylase [uncultured Modestobacter sp.]
MSPRHRRPFPSGRGIAVTAGVTTALVAFLPAAAAAPGMHPDWEPVVAGAEVDESQGSMSRLSGGSTRVAGPADPDLDTMSSTPNGDDDGYGSTDLDQDPSAFDRSGSRSGASSPLASSGIPSTAMEAYTAAAEANADCGISWTLIAAIGRVESNHGRFAGATLHTDGLSSPPIIGIALTGSGDTARITDSDGGRLDGDTVHDRAVGPMQFIPTTWAIYAADGNGDGRRDPFNIHDAAAAAGEYLCAAGKDLSTPAGQARAVFAYNHSDSYVASVLSLAATYAGTTPPRVPTPAGPAPALPPVDPSRPPALPRPPVSAAERPLVPAPQAPAPVPQRPDVEQPAPEKPAAEQPAPEKPAPEKPAPEQPAPEKPAPEKPAPEQPVPEQPVPEQPVPEQPVPEQPAPEQPVEEPAPAPTPCETADQSAAALTVDVVNGTGSAEAGAEVVARLTDGGLTIGEARDSADGPASGIAYPESAAADARSLAEALGMADLLRVEPVGRITVVLGSADSAALVEAVRAFTGLPCPTAEPAAEGEAATTEETAATETETAEAATTEAATAEAATTGAATTESATTEPSTAPATDAEPAGANG